MAGNSQGQNLGSAESDDADYMRHAAASRLIAAGLDDELIADQLGHEDSTITRRVYAHVYDRAEKVEQVRKALS